MRRGVIEHCQRLTGAEGGAHDDASEEGLDHYQEGEIVACLRDWKGWVEKGKEHHDGDNGITGINEQLLL